MFYKANLHKLGYEMSRMKCTTAHEMHPQNQLWSGVCSEAEFCQIHLYSISLTGFIALLSSGTVEAGS